MTISRLIATLSLIGIISSQAAREHMPLEERISGSVAIFRGTAIGNSAFENHKDSQIYTRTGFNVLEALKGTFSQTVQLENHGGILNGRGEVHCDTFNYIPGSDYLVFVQQRKDKTLYTLVHTISSAGEFTNQVDALRRIQPPGLDLSTEFYQFNPPSDIQAAVGVLPGTTGYGSRFLQCDRGEPIEYLVDMDVLPAGITTNQARTALSNAFAAWEAETSLTFKFAGYESFGQSANTVMISDRRIRVQLHDSYGYITSSSVLGRGGRGYSYNPAWPDGGLGARVGANEFDRTSRGYLVIEHTHASNTDPVTLEEVLTHEIGHVLSLGHSSETSGETDPELYEAQMFYRIHKDGRGASLQSWDLTNIGLFYPTNTPPYGYDRIIRALTSSPQPPLASGVNQVEFPSYDLQGGAFPIVVTNYALNGTFTLENANTLFYTCNLWFSDSSEAGPGSYYDLCYIRMSDGVNLSPPLQVRVIQFLSDGNRNYLPDSWESAYSISGSASGDDDNDGLTNLEEWLLGTQPNNNQSLLQMGISGSTLSWNSKTNELYQLQSTTNLTEGFANQGNPILADTTNEVISVESESQQFFRIQRLP